MKTLKMMLRTEWAIAAFCAAAVAGNVCGGPPDTAWIRGTTDALGYYDAAIFAKRIPTSCRTCITRAGLGDYCCPPTGLAKLYNNIPGNKEIHWMQGSQHGWPPPPCEGRDFVVKSEDGGGIRHAAKRRRATGTWVVEAGIRKFKLGRSGGEALAEAKAAETRPVTNATVYVDESVSLDELNARTFLPGTKVLFRFFNDWRDALTFSDNAWIAETESLCRFHGRPTANLTYRYPDHLDQIHEDNRAEIESQTVTPPRVFRANEKKAFLDFLVRRSNRK